jgi:hypothetical protein
MTIRHLGPKTGPPSADTPHVEVPLRNARPGDILPTGERIDRLAYARSGHTRIYYRDSTGYERSKMLADFTRVTRRMTDNRSGS